MTGLTAQYHLFKSSHLLSLLPRADTGSYLLNIQSWLGRTQEQWATAASLAHALNANFTTTIYLITSPNDMQMNDSPRTMSAMLDLLLANMTECYQTGQG